MNLRPNVEYYGGFLGNETMREQRDWVANPTVFDGSVSREGEPAYRVVWAADNMRLDGFVIRGGVANGPSNNGYNNGGGIFVPSGASPVIANCVIEENRADRYGGGLFGDDGAHPTLINCTIRNNNGSGVVAIRNGSLTVTDCLFEDNSVIGIWLFREGSGYHPNLDLDSSVFRDNSGGAVRTSGSATISNCLFVRNIAADSGGAIRHSGTQNAFGGPVGSGLYVNCTFYGNEAPASPHVYASYLSLTVQNCLFGGEPGSARPAVNAGLALTATYFNNLIPEGWTLESAEETEGTVTGAPAFVAPSLDNFRLRPESPAVDAGRAEDAPSEDLEGTARPVGEGVDIGAYEFDPETYEDPLDPSGDGMTNAVDVQMVINGALGAACEPCDINGDGKTDAVDVQFIINAVLGNV